MMFPSPITRGATQQRAMNREAPVEQVLLAADLDELDQIVLRERVQLAAAVPRIDEGVQSDFA